MSDKCAKQCAEPIDDLTAADMEKAIRERFDPITHCEVDDLGTCGTSYNVIIVSSIFEGKKTLEKHQLVNEKLKPEITRLHAFSQKTFTPAQWEKKQKEAEQ